MRVSAHLYAPGLLGAALAVLLLQPGPAHAASDGAGHFWWEWLNLGLLLAVLLYVARKPVLSSLADRRKQIQDDLADSERVLQEAETRLADWSAKAGRLEDEVGDIRRLARDRAEAERERILDEARRSADRVRSEATNAIQRELERARTLLREEAADLAVELAGEQLREQVTDADRSRLVDEFVTRVQQAAPGRGGPAGSA